MPELRSRYEKFEAERIKKAKELIGIDVDMQPDSFMLFVAKRTTLCPHKLVSPEAVYWLETVNLLDGEFGLTLPGPIEKIPALFFDALNIVRRARNKAKNEDSKDKKPNGK